MAGSHVKPRTGFWDLPAELRVEIYELSLNSDRPIVDPLHLQERIYRTDATSIPPLGIGLAAASRRLHNELDIGPLYLTNEFVFTTPQVATAFLKRLPNKYKDLLTRITVDLQSCVTADRERCPQQELEWFEYLSCPSGHYRTRNNEPCTARSCSHLFFDLPNVKHITLDVRVTMEKLIDRNEIRSMLAWLLRGTCNGRTEVETFSTCRPDLTVSLVPSGAQRTENCFSCRTGPIDEAWDPAWLCVGEKAVECRAVYGDVGRGEALPIALDLRSTHRSARAFPVVL